MAFLQRLSPLFPANPFSDIYWWIASFRCICSHSTYCCLDNLHNLWPCQNIWREIQDDIRNMIHLLLKVLTISMCNIWTFVIFGTNCVFVFQVGFAFKILIMFFNSGNATKGKKKLLLFHQIFLPLQNKIWTKTVILRTNCKPRDTFCTFCQKPYILTSQHFYFNIQTFLAHRSLYEYQLDSFD